MKKLKFLTLLVVTVLLFCGAGCQWFTKPEAEVTAPVEEIEQKATLVIDDGTENPQSFEFEVEEGTTVFDLLKEACEKANLKLDYSEFDFGVMVNTIGEKTGGEEGKYWLYYVNGEMAPVAVDKQEVKANDKVEFKFEK